jgi:hypothetical protein
VFYQDEINKFEIVFGSIIRIVEGPEIFIVDPDRILP